MSAVKLSGQWLTAPLVVIEQVPQGGHLTLKGASAGFGDGDPRPCPSAGVPLLDVGEAGSGKGVEVASEVAPSQVGARPSYSVLATYAPGRSARPGEAATT